MDKSKIYANPKDEGNTPYYVMDYFQKHYGIKFTYDPATSHSQARQLQILNYATIEDNGLTTRGTGNVGCNPPFSKKKHLLKKQLKKLKMEMLLPMAFETKLGQDVIFPNMSELGIPKGRIAFENNGSTSKTPAFGSCIVVFSPRIKLRFGIYKEKHLINTFNFGKE